MNQNYYAQPNPQPGFQQGGYRPQNRSLALAIILSIVTCGIYTLYWLYTLNEDMGAISGRKEMDSGLVILLTIVTCGIYGFIWNYQQGDKIDQLKMRNGISSSNTNIVYLVLAIFGFSIVNYALMQNEINAVADGRYHV